MVEPRSSWRDLPAEPWRDIAERRIEEAMAAGKFDKLAGEGQPLDLDENPFAPPHLRLAFRVLKNAGFAPDWIELGKEIDEKMAISPELDEKLRSAIGEFKQTFGV